MPIILNEKTPNNLTKIHFRIINTEINFESEHYILCVMI